MFEVSGEGHLFFGGAFCLGFLLGKVAFVTVGFGTAVSVIDDYHLGQISPQPVLGIYALGTVVPVVEPVVEVAEEADEVDEVPVKAVRRKVVKAPAKAAVAATEGVETK